MLIFYIGSPANANSRCKKSDNQCFLLAEPLHSLCPTPRSPAVSYPPPLTPHKQRVFSAPSGSSFGWPFQSTEWTGLGPRRGQERPPRDATAGERTAPAGRRRACRVGLGRPWTGRLRSLALRASVLRLKSPQRAARRPVGSARKEGCARRGLGLVLWFFY